MFLHCLLVNAFFLQKMPKRWGPFFVRFCQDLELMGSVGKSSTLLTKLSQHKNQTSGQIIATSAEVTPNGGLVRESPNNALNSGLGTIGICPETCLSLVKS